MKKLKILLSVLLIMFLTLPIVNASVVEDSYYVVEPHEADEDIVVYFRGVRCDGTWYYSVNEEPKTATIWAYKGKDKNVVIPEMFEGKYKVESLVLLSTGVSNDKMKLPVRFPAFEREIETLTIPKTLKFITTDKNRVADTTPTYPKGHENDTLVKDGKEIISGYFTIKNKGTLKAIYVDKDNPNFSSEDGVLYDKNKTTLISYPEGKQEEKYVIPNTVTNIFDCAFNQVSPNLRELVITENVKQIGKNSLFNAHKLYVKNFSILNNTLGEKELSKIFSNVFMDPEPKYSTDWGITVTVYKDSPAYKYYSVYGTEKN